MSEPLCTCGHPGGDHENDGSGACYRLERGPCMCEKFTPLARSRDEAEKAIAAVLREHLSFTSMSPADYTHLASVLADLMAGGQ